MKKKLISNMVEKLNNISTMSVGTACWIFVNQPKEPEALKKLINKSK